MIVANIKVAVYRFTLWDPDQGENVLAPRMATLATIEQVDGRPDRRSMLLIEESELDGEGFYPPESAS